MPQRPTRRLSQKASFPAPMAEMTPNPVMATRLLLAGMGGFLCLAGSALKGTVPLLGFEPLVNVRSAEAPVLAHFGGRDPAALGKVVEGRLGDLEVAVELLNGQDVGVHWRLPDSRDKK